MKVTNQVGACGCGRGRDGMCDGSHALTEEEWQAKLTLINENTVEPPKCSCGAVPNGPCNRSCMMRSTPSFFR